MVGTGKLLADGHVNSCCPAYISRRQPVSPPLVSEILDCEDVCKKDNKKNRSFSQVVWRVLCDTREGVYDGHRVVRH